MSNEDKNKKDLKNKQTEENERKSAFDEKRTELHKFKDEQLVDDIPMEDLEIEEKNTKDKTNSQSTSQTEEKYRKAGKKK